MSNQQCKVLVPPPVAEPRAAAWAVAAWCWVQNSIESPVAAQPGRSAAELLALAHEVEPEAPSLAAELRRFALQRRLAPCA